MSKWFDANGVDVDAYPDRAFKGGVYDGGILGKPERRQHPRVKVNEEVEVKTDDIPRTTGDKISSD